MSLVRNAWEFNESIQGQIDSISTPLHNLGITYFTYSKLYKDGKAFIITNETPSDKMFQHLFSHGLCFSEPFVKVHQNKKYAFIWPEGRNPALQSMGINIWNGINFYVDRGSYIENWCYSQDHYDGEKTNFYVNNLEFLEKYINYFRENLNSLTDRIDKRVLINFKAPEIDKHLGHRSVEKTFLPKNQKRFYVYYNGVDAYLTPQEFRCIIYLGHGFCPKEVALKLGLSLRTVQMYFDNVKKRFSLGFLGDLRKFSIYINKIF